ncbi:MAG TPA: GGDEF domain-containing protein [Candidatus Acidoferrales bacterium]|jgi:diguanylate cyclase (GGDEF)-like protein|nr:GGDEF domain-containing protein [Candidatus Acidoferrales bacterium]
MSTIKSTLPGAPAEDPGKCPVKKPPVSAPDAAADAPADVPSENRLTEIQASLRKLERRDWWLWMMAIIVMLLLTVAVVSMSFPELLKTDDAFFRFSLNQAVRGLVGLVLLFNTYTIYQQVQVKRLRRQLSEQLEAMGRLRVRAEEFHRLATIDPLTGLYNRRFAEHRLAAEASRSQRYGHPLTVISFDLNNFKKINDKHGHPAGDSVLKAFADRLNSAIRVSDWAVRMGGDEFLAILPECAIGQVQSLINRIAKVEAEHEGAHIPVAFSYGCVGYEPGETPQRFLERADELLYADKRRSKKAAPQLSYAHQ